VNSLPMTVTRQRHDCYLNPDLSAPESSTLTTQLPSHPDSRCRQCKRAGAISVTCCLSNSRVSFSPFHDSYCRRGSRSAAKSFIALFHLSAFHSIISGLCNIVVELK